MAKTPKAKFQKQRSMQAPTEKSRKKWGVVDKPWDPHKMIDPQEMIDRIRYNRNREFGERLRLDLLREEGKADTYFRDIERFKKDFLMRFKPSKPQIQIAKTKLELLMAKKTKVLRMENLGKAITHLRFENAFENEEVSVKDYDIKLDSDLDSPAKIGLYYYNYFAHERTDSPAGFYKYTSIVFFDHSAWSGIANYDRADWSYIKHTKKNPILGIQVLDPNPQAVYQAAKAMLSVRPHDPVVIFDLYGNVFFP